MFDHMEDSEPRYPRVVSAIVIGFIVVAGYGGVFAILKSLGVW